MRITNKGKNGFVRLYIRSIYSIEIQRQNVVLSSLLQQKVDTSGAELRHL